MESSQIAVRFSISTPGILPGMGIMNTYELHFEDSGGRMMTLISRMDNAREGQKRALEKAATAQGLMKRFWYWRYDRLSHVGPALESKVRDLIPRMWLSIGVKALKLRVSISNGEFKNVVFVGQVNDLMKKLRRGEHLQVYALKPKTE